MASLVSDFVGFEILFCCNHMLSVRGVWFFSFSFPAAAIGISFIQFSNNNSMRNHYVLGLALFLGISIPQYFVSNTTGDGHGPVRADGGWVSRITTPQALSYLVSCIFWPSFDSSVLFILHHHLVFQCEIVKKKKKPFYTNIAMRNMFGGCFRTYDFHSYWVNNMYTLWFCSSMTYWIQFSHHLQR